MPGGRHYFRLTSTCAVIRMSIRRLVLDQDDDGRAAVTSWLANACSKYECMVLAGHGAITARPRTRYTPCTIRGPDRRRMPLVTTAAPRCGLPDPGDLEAHKQLQCGV
jgi:hypothetical protein